MSCTDRNWLNALSFVAVIGVGLFAILPFPAIHLHNVVRWVTLCLTSAPLATRECQIAQVLFRV